MKRKCFVILCIVLLGVSCYKKEGKLSPSNDPEDLISLPQGNHAYDDVIMEWYSKYGFTALYIFTDRNIYWNNETWLQGDDDRTMDSTVGGGDEVGEPGDQGYVGEWCDMFETLFLDHYSDSLLADVMPFRVFICSGLWTAEKDLVSDTYVYEKIWIYEGWDNIAVNGASSYICDSLTRQDQLDFSQVLNGYFIQKMAEKDMFSIPVEFYQESDYSNSASISGLELFKNGYVKQVEYFSRQDKESYKKGDLQAFMELMAYPLDYLEKGELEEIGSYDTEPSLSGLFRRPEAAKVKKKYDVLLKVLKEMGIKMEDIQNPPVVSY